MIRIFRNECPYEIKKIRQIKQILGEIAAEHSRIIKELNIVLLTDEELLKMNNTHLSHDFYTDIITFDLSSGNENIEGELYISWQRVYENASTLGMSLQEEMQRLFIHGMLHLVGYKDKTKTQKEQMTTEENRYISKIVSRETQM